MYLRIGLLLVFLGVCGCVNTVAPAVVRPTTIAIHPTGQNGGILGQVKDSQGRVLGVIIDSELRDKYNFLIAQGYGRPPHVIPGIVTDQGLGLQPGGETWYIPNEYLADLITMNLLYRSGIKP